MNSLPNEVLFRIFNYVDDQRDRCRLAATSRRLYLAYAATKNDRTASFDEAAYLTTSRLDAFLVHRATKLESLSIANCAPASLPSCAQAGWASLRQLDLRGSCMPKAWDAFFAGLECVESLAIDLRSSLSQRAIQSLPASLKSLTIVIGKAVGRFDFDTNLQRALRPFYAINLKSFHVFFALNRLSVDMDGLYELHHLDAGLASYHYSCRAHRVAFDDPTRSFAKCARGLASTLQTVHPDGESSFRHLTVLRLATCNITDALLLGLSPLEHLLELDLSYNARLSRDGLFNFLLENNFSSMKKFRIAGNSRIFCDKEFYSQGLTTIAESMPLLEYLDVGGIYKMPVPLNLDDHHRVSSCIQSLPRLRKLHMFIEFFLRPKHCPFQREMDSDFERVVQSNPALSHLYIGTTVFTKGSPIVAAPTFDLHLSFHGVSLWRNLTCLYLFGPIRYLIVLNNLDVIAERCLCLREFALGNLGGKRKNREANLERLLTSCLTKFNKLQKFGLEEPMSASQRFFESLACLTELRYCRIDLDNTRPTFDSDVILRIVDNAPHLIAFHLFCHSSASIRAQCSAMIQSRGRKSLHVFIGPSSGWNVRHHWKERRSMSGENLESWWEDVGYHNVF